MCQPAATISFSVEPAATVSRSVKSVMRIVTVLTPATKPTAGTRRPAQPRHHRQSLPHSPALHPRRSTTVSLLLAQTVTRPNSGDTRPNSSMVGDKVSVGVSDRVENEDKLHLWLWRTGT